MPAPQNWGGESSRKNISAGNVLTAHNAREEWQGAQWKPAKAPLSQLLLSQQWQTVLAPDIHRRLERMSLC